MKNELRDKVISFEIYLLNLLLLLLLLVSSELKKTYVVQIQTGLVVVYLLIMALHLICVYKNKTRKVSLFNIFIIILFLEFHMQDMSILTDCENETAGKLIVVLIVSLTVLEYVLGRYKEWKQMLYQWIECRFNARHNGLFYRIIWKNFKKNWKDYLLIIVCNIILFTISIIIFSLKEMLDRNYGIKKIQVFNGLSEILINAMIPIVVLAVFLIVILVFYYLKTRANNYGIFLTLGMHRKTLYFITALEFIIVFLVSMMVGFTIGKVFLGFIIKGIEGRFDIPLSIENISIKPYLYSVGMILSIILVSFMAARDIFYDFNVGKAEDVRAIAEKLPGKSRYVYLLVGLSLCVFSVFQYQELHNFENVNLLLVFFIGLFLFIRHGMAVYLIRERKNKNYIRKLMIHNQLFHKSMTNAGFITVLSIIQFCILFYFSFQLIGCLIAEDAKSMFPYDFVCFADEGDNYFFQKLQDNHSANVYEFPMVRVTAYDSTERLEDRSKDEYIQGQHIGISESTYHELKSLLNSSYQMKGLKLGKTDKKIHIVYQQDKSIKAHPTAYYIPRKKPLLHIGAPCRKVNKNRMHGKYDNGYYYYTVVGEEIGSLIGNFHQGLRENIIVFSDDYFEQAKEMWKTRDIRYGELIKDEELRIPNFTIAQGVTKLILLNVSDENLSDVSNELRQFNQRHLNEEIEIYKSIYDSSVSYLYEKEGMELSIRTERTMKIIMSIAAIVLFLSMNLLLLIVKMLSELYLTIRRAEFLNCMGMRKKERKNLIYKEIMKYYCLIPVGIALVGGIIYTVAVFRARMYTIEDIKQYMNYLISMGSIYILGYIMIVLFVTMGYVRKIEKKI